MSQNNSNKSPNILGKIIWGFISRIIITIIFAVALSIFVPKCANLFKFDLKGWFKPVLIIGSILLGIALEIEYAVRVYKIMKSNYMALEQQAANAAMATFQDGYNYTQYPNEQYSQMNQPYQQNYQVNPNNDAPSVSGQTFAQAAAPVTAPEKKSNGCFNLFVFLIMTVVLLGSAASIISNMVDYRNAEKNYDLIEATITNVSSYTRTSYDEDGDETTTTHYDIDYEYTYNDKVYTSHKNDTSKYSKEEQIQIYVDPADPENTVLYMSNGSKITSWVFLAVIIVVWVFVTSAMFKKKT